MFFTFPWVKRSYHYCELSASTDDRRAIDDPDVVQSPKHRRILDSQGLLSLLLLLNILLLSAFLRLQFVWKSVEPGQDKRLFKSPIPIFPHEIKRFDTHPTYMARPSNESNAAWHLLGGPLGVHQGFIAVENSKEYGLGSAPSDNGKEMYGVSMLHQLHCLGAIRKMFWGVLEGALDPQALLEGYPNDTADPTFDALTSGLWHVNHCFDYIRQAIQCAGDMSLEWPVEIHGENLVVGWNNPHECVSWASAWDYIETHSD